MNRRLIVLLLLGFGAAAGFGAELPAPAKPAVTPPGIWAGILKPWRYFQGSKEPENKASTHWKNLTLTLTLDPMPLKLSEVRQLKTTLALINTGGRLRQLEFPSTQRIEVLVRNSSGKLLEQWSEDQAFSSEPTVVAVNPNERLEYSVSVSTRDMAPGERYTVEAYISSYKDLKAVKQIVPEK